MTHVAPSFGKGPKHFSALLTAFNQRSIKKENEKEKKPSTSVWRRNAFWGDSCRIVLTDNQREGFVSSYLHLPSCQIKLHDDGETRNIPYNKLCLTRELK